MERFLREKLDDFSPELKNSSNQHGIVEATQRKRARSKDCASQSSNKLQCLIVIFLGNSENFLNFQKSYKNLVISKGYKNFLVFSGKFSGIF